MTFIGNKDFYLEVLKGNVAGHSVVAFNGHNDDAGATEETLWNEGGLVAFPTSGSTMTVSSDSANDTSDGSGLRTVRINGCDDNFLQIAENITLNGTTEVTTTLEFFRVNTMIGLTAGSGGKNAGHIYIGTGSVSSGKPAVVVNLIDTGNNLTDSGFFSVPASQDAYVLNAIFTGVGGKASEVAVYTRVDGSLFLRVAEFDLDNGPVNLARIVPFRRIPPKTDIELRGASGGAGSADVRAFITLILVDR